MEGAVLGPGVLGTDAPGGGPGGQFWVQMVLDICWWLLGVRFPQRQAGGWSTREGSCLTLIQLATLHRGWSWGDSWGPQPPDPW